MNDRFRFRTPIYGADGKFKKFVYWNAENGFPATTCRIGDVFKEAEQCTGLSDKNGRLVYEGDIVKCCLTDKSKQYLFCRAERNGKNKDFILTKIIIPDVYVGFFPNDWEVVGNIHENANLLEEKSEKPIL